MLFIFSKQTQQYWPGKSRQGRLCQVSRGDFYSQSSVFTFQLIYIHANKEIDATKLYRLKYPRTFQDLFLQSYSTN